MKAITLPYPAEHLRDWKLGLLHEEWYRRAKKTFCEIDLSNAAGQCHRGYHFGEWFVARHYLELGYQVLPEKYLLDSRPQALEKATELLGPVCVDFLTSKIKLVSKLRWPPNPDLLVFKGKRYCFVEVKRDRDRLSPAQKEFFPMLEKKFNCSVTIVSLRPSRT